jgi:hypothetical protein
VAPSSQPAWARRSRLGGAAFIDWGRRRSSAGGCGHEETTRRPGTDWDDQGPIGTTRDRLGRRDGLGRRTGTTRRNGTAWNELGSRDGVGRRGGLGRRRRDGVGRIAPERPVELNIFRGAMLIRVDGITVAQPPITANQCTTVLWSAAWAPPGLPQEEYGSRLGSNAASAITIILSRRKSRVYE